MSRFRFQQLAVSLDGFVAGPDQSEENPFGVGGMELHDTESRGKPLHSGFGESSSDER